MAYNNDSKLPSANEKITAREVRLVDDQGQMLGVFNVRDALRMAKDKGFDLVEISPGAVPPVCKMLDFGKYKFEQQRKKHDNKKKQRVVHIKEIKLRPTIDKHDLEIKMRSVVKFITAGDKVKFSLKFRGREVTHHEIGMALMERIKEQILEIAKVEYEPRMEGKQIVMIIAPK